MCVSNLTQAIIFFQDVGTATDRIGAYRAYRRKGMITEQTNCMLKQKNKVEYTCVTTMHHNKAKHKQPRILKINEVISHHKSLYH